ncbi:MAG: class I SAM-dependent methyltransferase [Planctomycetaceae bacterium]
MRIPFTKYAFRRFNARLEQQYIDCAAASRAMNQRSHARYHIINALLRNTTHRRYLEIGVRNPEDNFNRIEADFKVSVDPGVEATINHATYPMTSDAFFEQLLNEQLHLEHKQFDVIFIDGLHLAEQVYRDIQNSLKIVADIGYVVLHDCSPPTIHHARENVHEQGPATHFWNGTSWKAYQRFRTESQKKCFVVDVDWGVGVIANHDESPDYQLCAERNPFYEYNVMDADRKHILNLVQPLEAPELAPHLSPADRS